MPKHDSKSKKHRKKNKYDDLLLKPEKLVSKLLKWSRTGRARKLDAVLDACGEGARALAAVKDLHGMTLLHQACQSGHEDAVRVLLRHGADTEARDTYGNTPAHTAAAASQLMVLQLLLTCAHPPDITLRNARGVSIEDLVEHKLEIDRNPPATSPALLGGTTAGRGQGLESMSVSEEEQKEDPDAAWSRRLAEEASDGEGGRQGHSTSWHGSDAAGGMGGGEEDEEAWADRLWQEMQHRRRQTARNAARSFASTFAEAHAAEQAQKDAAHAETMARLAAAQKLLQEEQAKDQRWRRQAAQGGLIENGVVRLAPLDPAIARRVYDERWAALDLSASETATSGGIGQLGLADVPWPLPEGHPYSVDNLRDVLLGDAQGPADIRRRLRAELMRWHPDKFSARFDRLVRPSDLAAVLARVKDISQGLTAMLVT